MSKCGICKCICDPTDLLYGICDECREKRRKTVKMEEIKRLTAVSASGQMEILGARGPCGRGGKTYM